MRAKPTNNTATQNVRLHSGANLHSFICLHGVVLNEAYERIYLKVLEHDSETRGPPINFTRHFGLSYSSDRMGDGTVSIFRLKMVWVRRLKNQEGFLSMCRNV
jgi:hypothetical protein